MIVHLLVTDEMKPVPKTITVQNIFEEGKTIVDNRGKVLAVGDNLLVEGSEEALKNWLKPYNVWVGNGACDTFRMMHIK